MKLHTSGDYHTIRYWIDDREVSAEEYQAAMDSIPSKLEELLGGDAPATNGTTTWPLHSEALACHPKQVEAMNARNARHGIAARYDKETGVCIIPTPSDRRKLMKLEGVFDKRSFS